MAFDAVHRLSGLDPVRLDGVRVVRGGQPRLDGLSARFSATGVTALLGPNGAGKSLTLRVILGLVAVDAGRVFAPQPAGLCPQRPALLRRSVRGVLDHALRAAGVARRDRPARLDALIAETKIEALADRPARMLSGGERQRVAIARALAARPKLLALDEPTAHLDPSATALIEGMVRDAAGQGVKVVIATHDVAQARRVADDVAFLHRGGLDAQADADRFFQAPPSEAARRYLIGDLLT